MKKSKGINFQEANRIASISIHDWFPDIEKGRPASGGWINGMPNPTRPDRDPDSFGVNPQEGRYHDFTGETHDLLHMYAVMNGLSEKDAALHFLPKDNTPEYHADLDAIKAALEKTKPLKGWDHTHIYTDGTCSFAIGRKNAHDGIDKEIRPFTILPDGTTIIGKPAKPPQGFPLLNLDKILSDETGKTIVLVEGEVKSESIPEEYIATAIAGGASGWKDTDFSPLEGKNVILWPDNDDAGKKCMAGIAAEIDTIAKTVKMVEPCVSWEKGKDAANFSYKERQEILSETKRQEKKSAFPLIKVGSRELKPRQWLIKNLFPKHSFTSIFGASYTGKSFVAVDLSCRVASGEPFCGYPVKTPGAVVYVAGEGYDGIEKRFLAWSIKNGKNLSDLPVYISLMPTALGNDEMLKILAESVREVAKKHDGKISMIVFDTWARNFEGNENDSADTNAAVRSVDNLRNEYECAALIVHHTGKGDQTKARGSSVLYGSLDLEFNITNKKSIIGMENTKMKDGIKPPTFMFGFENIVVGLDEEKEEENSSVLNQINIDGILGKEETPKETPAKSEAFAMEVLRKNPSGMLSSVFLSELKEKMCKETAYKIKKKLLSEEKAFEIDGKIMLQKQEKPWEKPQGMQGKYAESEESDIF